MSQETVEPLIPFQIADRAIESISADNLLLTVNQHWRMVLFTMPGESISHPNFGCGLQRALFENWDRNHKITGVNIVDNIKGTIRNQAQIWMPYLTVQDINIAPSELNPNQMMLQIKYYLRMSGLEASLSVPLPQVSTDGNPELIGDYLTV